MEGFARGLLYVLSRIPAEQLHHVRRLSVSSIELPLSTSFEDWKEVSGHLRGTRGGSKRKIKILFKTPCGDDGKLDRNGLLTSRRFERLAQYSSWKESLSINRDVVL